MDFEKARYQLQNQFNKNPLDEALTGKLASAYMETRDFKKAYEILKYGAEKIPCVETYTNLGYFYIYEGEPEGDRWRYQEEKAISVLEKAISLNPQSHNPYSVLGEAYLVMNKDSNAEVVLKKAVGIEQTSANLNNLGVALYRQNKFNEAKIHFYNSHLKGNFKYNTFRSYLNYGMTLAKLGMKEEAAVVAKDLINNRTNKSCEVDTIDIINIYYEIKDLSKVMELYPIAFEETAISPQEFGMYIFALKQLGYENTIEKLYTDILKDKDELIKDIKEDDEIDEESKEYQVNNALTEITELQNSYNKVKNGETIQSSYQPFIEKDCYLFGCLRHKNPNGNDIVGNKGVDVKDRAELTILAIFVLCGSLLIFQLISYFSNIDFLAPFPGFNFIITPICIALTFVTLYIFNKTRYMAKVLNSIGKLINSVKKYPHLHRILKFIYRHPLISAFVVGIIWAIVKNICITYFT